MENTCSEIASELLRQCLENEPWDAALVERLATPECSDALFRIAIEGLADRFEPRLCDDYAAIFSLVIEHAIPGQHAFDLYARYCRIRRPRVCEVEPKCIVVLSRVTLGADIAVTSVMLDGLALRFPRAEIYLAGSVKAAELYAGLDRYKHLEVPYPRAGDLPSRLAPWRSLQYLLAGKDAIVIDPDTRLTQLGLLPVCDEDRYYFFESRAYGGDGDKSLTELAHDWVCATFGEGRARNLIFPPVGESPIAGPYATVSLGSGGNSAKQLPERLEAVLIQLLCERFPTVVVDRGLGAEESQRVERAIAGTPARTFEGSFAQFASLIAGSSCYAGYDSAGQHAAASFGTPLLTVFKGFASDRMFARWRPTGPGPKQILKVTGLSVEADEIAAALDGLLKKA